MNPPGAVKAPEASCEITRPLLLERDSPGISQSQVCVVGGSRNVGRQIGLAVGNCLCLCAADAKNQRSQKRRGKIPYKFAFHFFGLHSRKLERAPSSSKSQLEFTRNLHWIRQASHGYLVTFCSYFGLILVTGSNRNHFGLSLHWLRLQELAQPFAGLVHLRF